MVSFVTTHKKYFYIPLGQCKNKQCEESSQWKILLQDIEKDFAMTWISTKWDSPHDIPENQVILLTGATEGTFALMKCSIFSNVNGAKDDFFR